ncbi:hypothetical protein B4Q13_15915, partial [Lacticaseibacillus rhamnosus]
MLGSPGYFSPEQARGDERLDARADVFALGAVLFECLTGKAAFAAEHVIKRCSVAQIIEHGLARESLVRRLDPAAGVAVQTAMGDFNLIAFESMGDSLPHIALTVGGVGRLDGGGRPVEV